MKTLLIVLFLLISYSSLSFGQTEVSESDKLFMTGIVQYGIDNNPASFFNKGKDYDYKSNITVREIIIPNKQDYPGIEGRAASHFFCILKYTIEGEENESSFKVLIRKNKQSGQMEFYSANFSSQKFD